MNLEWWNWVLLAEGTLVLALIIFATVYAVRARRFKVGGENEKRQIKNNKIPEGLVRIALNFVISIVLIGLIWFLLTRFICPSIGY